MNSRYLQDERETPEIPWHLSTRAKQLLPRESSSSIVSVCSTSHVTTTKNFKRAIHEIHKRPLTCVLLTILAHVPTQPWSALLRLIGHWSFRAHWENEWDRTRQRTHERGWDRTSICIVCSLSLPESALGLLSSLHSSNGVLWYITAVSSRYGIKGDIQIQSLYSNHCFTAYTVRKDVLTKGCLCLKGSCSTNSRLCRPWLALSEVSCGTISVSRSIVDDHRCRCLSEQPARMGPMLRLTLLHDH